MLFPPLAQRREPFDHPDWIFELEYDGFRALAYVDGGGAKLVSRKNVPYRRFDELASHLSLEMNADDVVLDGEPVKLHQTPTDLSATASARSPGVPSSAQRAGACANVGIYGEDIEDNKNRTVRDVILIAKARSVLVPPQTAAKAPVRASRHASHRLGRRQNDAMR